MFVALPSHNPFAAYAIADTGTCVRGWCDSARTDDEGTKAERTGTRTLAKQATQPDQAN